MDQPGILTERPAGDECRLRSARAAYLLDPQYFLFRDRPRDSVPLKFRGAAQSSSLPAPPAGGASEIILYAHRGAYYMKIRPLHDRILVKRLEEERKTASGIVIPDTAAEKPDQGEVVEVGSGKILEDGKVRPLDVKRGDKILFGKYSGQTVKVKGEELLVIREEDVMGVLEAA
jgi:chaperonin GroES